MYIVQRVRSTFYSIIFGAAWKLSKTDRNYQRIDSFVSALLWNFQFILTELLLQIDNGECCFFKNVLILGFFSPTKWNQQLQEKKRKNNNPEPVLSSYVKGLKMPMITEANFWKSFQTAEQNSSEKEMGS